MPPVKVLVSLLKLGTGETLQGLADRHDDRILSLFPNLAIGFCGKVDA
jgi:hypothetical protein